MFTKPMLRLRTVPCLCLGLFMGLLVAADAPAQSFDPVRSYGVWDRGDEFDAQEFPFLRGFSCNLQWREVEKQPGIYDWSHLGRALERTMKCDQNLYISIDVGPDAPTWIYSSGVPSVATTGANGQDKKWKQYPFYASTAYKGNFERLIRSLSAEIRKFPSELQGRIAFIQVKCGCTGDECAYKGEVVDPRFDLSPSSKGWSDFRIWSFGLFNECFQGSTNERMVPLLFNNITPDDDSDEGTARKSGRTFNREWEWVIEHVKGGFGIKIPGSARGHHLLGEKSKILTWQPRLIGNPTPLLFARSEMDQTWMRPMYSKNLPLNFYWGAITGLQNGQSIWDISKSAMESCRKYGFDYSFRFFNRYAGQTNPTTATDAFCALHKGLDAADTRAYPEDRFGTSDRNNIDRMLKICGEFSRYGAEVDDPRSLLLDQPKQRASQNGFNDVGWDIWSDNYGRFLEQIDADLTSVALWRIGGAITATSSIYGRFGRGFEASSGRNGLYFKLADGFSADATAKVMTVKVVWYDQIPGSTWRLQYDAGGESMKTGLSVIGTGDRLWHHESVVINDAVFRKGGTRGSDLALVNSDGLDDIFSLVEIHRGRSELPDPLPPTAFSVPDAKADPQGAKVKNGRSK